MTLINPNNITAIVATHEREFSLSKMINSFKYYYPDLKIIVADSSKQKSNKFKDKLITYIHMDSCLGISLQRNTALQEVKTPHFLLLDDDYIFTENTNLEMMILNLIDGNYDIIGGKLNNIGSQNYDFHGTYDIIGDVLYHLINFPGNDNIQVIFNFFIGNTFKIKAFGWDNNLRFAREHDDFFINAKDNFLKIGYLDNAIIDHYSYKKYHGGKKSEGCVKYFLNKRNIKNKVEIRYIKTPFLEYISYHNCIINSLPPSFIIEKIRKELGDIKIIYN